MNLNEQDTFTELSTRGGFNPIGINDSEVKELEGYDWAALRYASADYIKYNASTLLLDDEQSTLDSIDDYSAIEDNRLYLNGFEGYRFGDSFEYALICFAFSTNNRLIGLIRKYDDDGNEISQKWYLMD